MGGEEVKGGPVVPESVLKKQKRNEEWALVKQQEVEVAKKKRAENRKLIFKRAKLYAKEYDEQVREVIIIASYLASMFWYSFCWNGFWNYFYQQKELIQLKREAKLKGGFYVDPEAKLLFIIRIRGYVIHDISVILALILDAEGSSLIIAVCYFQCQLIMDYF